MKEHRLTPGQPIPGTPARWNLAIEQCMRNNAIHYATAPIALVRDAISAQSDQAKSLYAEVMSRKGR